MKDHEGCVRGFIWSSKAWYSPGVVDGPEVTFGMYEPGQGTSGEMVMRWHNLGSMVPRLEVFCDAWDALQQFQDVLVELAKHDAENITDEEFVTILKTCGVQDLTEYETPYSKDAHLRRRLEELETEKGKIEKQLGL